MHRILSNNSRKKSQVYFSFFNYTHPLRTDTHKKIEENLNLSCNLRTPVYNLRSDIVRHKHDGGCSSVVEPRIVVPVVVGSIPIAHP